MDEAVAQLQALGNFDQRDIQRAVAAANGNLELAASFLMEGGPPRAIPIGHIPNEVRIAMQPGPGKITMAEPPPPAILRNPTGASPNGKPIPSALAFFKDSNPKRRPFNKARRFEG